MGMKSRRPDRPPWVAALGGEHADDPQPQAVDADHLAERIRVAGESLLRTV